MAPTKSKRKHLLGFFIDRHRLPSRALFHHRHIAPDATY
jgi:hypothetical protein